MSNFVRCIQRLISAKLFYRVVLRVLGVNIAKATRRQRALAEMSLHDYDIWVGARVRRVVAAGMQTSAHYKSVVEAAHARPELPSTGPLLPNLPVIEKSDLRAIGEESQAYSKAQFSVLRKTAGSTGDPVSVVIGANKLANELAARDMAYNQYGGYLGEREARLWGRKENYGFKSRCRDFLLNRRVFDLSNNLQSDEEILADIRRWRPDYVYGYSSLVLRLAELMVKRTARLDDLRFVICTAENLEESQRIFIQDSLGCPVFVEYGCSEVDIIASECPQGTLHVNSANVLLEQIQSKDGVEELLVTDLRNSRTPVIRYRLGDIVKIQHRVCECGRASQSIDEICGRSQDQFVIHADGSREHSVLFSHMFSELERANITIKRFLVIQRDILNFELVVDALHGLESDLYRGLEQLMTAKFGSEVSFDLRLEEVELPQGSKATYFVPMAKD